MSIHLDSINIFVSDMKRSMEFYSLLGFKIDHTSFTKNYVKLDLNGISLCFYTLNIVKDYFSDPSIFIYLNHQFELSFRLNTPNEVDVLFNKIIEANFKSFMMPQDSDWNQRVAFILDPDNNLIELCSFINN